MFHWVLSDFEKISAKMTISCNEGSHANLKLKSDLFDIIRGLRQYSQAQYDLIFYFIDHQRLHAPIWRTHKHVDHTYTLFNWQYDIFQVLLKSAKQGDDELDENEPMPSQFAPTPS